MVRAEVRSKNLYRITMQELGKNAYPQLLDRLRDLPETVRDMAAKYKLKSKTKLSNARVPFAHTIYSSILNRQHSVFQAAAEKLGGRNAAWRELQDAKLTPDEYAEVLELFRKCLSCLKPSPPTTATLFAYPHTLARLGPIMTSVGH